MKNLLLTILVIGIGLGISCTQTRSKVDGNNSLKIGGIYLIENGDGTYGSAKIKAIDDDLMFLKLYSNNFNKIPKNLNKVYMHELASNVLLQKDEFLNTNPVLLRVEKVEEGELEAYNLHLQAKMNK